MNEEKNEVEINDNNANNNKIRLGYLIICASLVLLIILMLPRPAKPVSDDNGVNVTASDDETEDTPIKMAGMDVFKVNHRVFASAIAMYAAEHNGENAQSIYDLSDYIDVDEFIDNPSGATYDLSVDSDNNLTLTSTFMEEELTYTN